MRRMDTKDDSGLGAGGRGLSVSGSSGRADPERMCGSRPRAPQRSDSEALLKELSLLGEIGRDDCDLFLGLDLAC